MITRIVKAKVKPEFVSIFRTYINTFLAEARGFKNNHHADCFADLEDQNHFHIYTIWTTDGALNKFLKSEINLAFKSNLNDWCQSPYSAWTVETI